MTLFSIGIRDDGEVLTIQKAPHQGSDCDGLVYGARDEEGYEVFLFFVRAVNKGEAVITARESFNSADYLALDPMWQPGSIWPDTADINTPDMAQVQIYSKKAQTGYITTVPTHGKVNPFIDHYGDTIMWAYMRDIEARHFKEVSAVIERWRDIRRRQEEKQRQTTVGDPTGVVAEPHQLFLDFG